MPGWIKISREIQEHWIYSDPNKLKWWIDILLSTNFEDKKFAIGYRVFECKRGECLMSLKSWGERWGVSKTVVYNFFTMLENDNMIRTVNETVTTRLIICNYDSYQQNENANKTQTKRNSTATVPKQYPTKEREELEERKENTIQGWRENFQIYLSELRKAYSEIIKNKEWLAEKQKYYPKLNIPLSLEKCCKEYWATEAGWLNKKKSKTKEINWTSTFNNSLSQKMNQVWLNDTQNGKPPTKTDY